MTTKNELRIFIRGIVSLVRSEDKWLARRYYEEIDAYLKDVVILPKEKYESLRKKALGKNV